MANNFPGVTRRLQPVVGLIQNRVQRAAAAAGGVRILAIIGEGASEETLVATARGGGSDGLNSDYSGNDSPDGRHFQISKIALIPNRTQILLNDVELEVLEEAITSDTFDSRYDVRVDPDTGRVELQKSHLISFGGTGAGATYYTASEDNTGNGIPNITSDSLIDDSAPAETWTARVTAVVKNGSGNTITGQATISVSGSTSGVIKDTNGSPIRWKSDGVFVDNGILNIAFTEGSTVFAVGDRFTFSVGSRVLKTNDKLDVVYIATENLNDPELFLDAEALFVKHGRPSETNTISLGAQMAFANGAPSILALQAKPALPRRTSLVLLEPDNLLTDDTEGATGNADIEDTIFPLPIGARPDSNSQINIFVMSADGTEEQQVLTKHAFYDNALDTEALAYTGFVTSSSFSSAYTVVETPEVEDSGIDGYVHVLSSTTIHFSAATAAFTDDRIVTGEGDVGKHLYFLDPAGLAGATGSFARYTITIVGDGYGDNTVCTATRVSGAAITAGFVFNDVKWQLVDENDVSVQFAVTDDVATTKLTSGKGLRIDYIDDDDADFFDTNWGAALTELEVANCQIVVPLPTQAISNIFQATRTHVETMSNIENSKERICIIGAILGLTPDNLVGREDAAVEDIGLLEGIQGDDVEEVLESNIEDLANYSVEDAFGTSFRTVYMAPDQIVVNIAGTNTELSGYFLAPALGGFLAGHGNVAEPPTFKVLNGFSILRSRTYRQFTLDELADAGVLVVQPVAGGGRMLHGLTTSQSGAPEDEEISIVAIRDQAARALRNALSAYVGTVQTQTTIASITDTVNGTVDALISQGLLASKGAISVSRDPVEPRQIDVVVQVAPSAPIDWIFVSLTVQI